MIDIPLTVEDLAALDVVAAALAFWIGVPPDFDPERRATIHGRGGMRMLLHLNEVPLATVLAMVKPGSPLGVRAGTRRR